MFVNHSIHVYYSMHFIYNVNHCLRFVFYSIQANQTLIIHKGLIMTSVATRLSPKELDYVSRIASENKLYKGNSKELSLGKAMHELIRWCHINQVDINKNQNGLSGELAKMIEHIHIAIPNLMYLARLQTVLTSDGVPEEKLINGRRQTVDYLNRSCGDFQNVQYTQVRFSINDIGLKFTPVDKEKTLWKLPSI